MLFHMARAEPSRMGFLLAGGKSSRMGANTDKAFLDFGGQTLLDRALTVMGAVCDRVTIVGDPAKFAKYGSLRNMDQSWPTFSPDAVPSPAFTPRSCIPPPS